MSNDETQLQGTSQGNSKFIQVGKIETQNLYLTPQQQEFIQLLHRGSKPKAAGTLNVGHPPKRLTHWQGREEEITRITEWLKDDRVIFVGIEGVGGIGKSSLASKIYGEVEGFYGHFWADVYTGTNFFTLAREIVTAFGYPFSGQESDLMNVLINGLRSQPYLIVIDNLESLLTEEGEWESEFYREFFGAWLEHGDKSKILVTSREKPKMRGLKPWIRLKGLKKPEGALILAQLGIKGDLEGFSEGVQGHPLLLRLVADLLIDEYPQDASLDRLEDLGLGNLRQLLTDPQVVGVHHKQDVGMALVLDASFGRLTPFQQQLFLRVSVYRREFDAVAAAYLMEENLTPPTPLPYEGMGEIREEALRERLSNEALDSPRLVGEGLGERLTDISPLIQENSTVISPLNKGGRGGSTNIEQELRNLYKRSFLEETLKGKNREYSFQAILSEYARYKAGDQTKDHLKALKYYVDLSQDPPWQTLEDVQPYLEGVYHFLQLGERDSAFDTLRSINNFLTLRGYYGTLVESFSDIVNAYERIGDKQNFNYLICLTSLGHAYYFQGQYSQAINYYQQCLETSKQIGDSKGEVNSYIGLGNAYYSLEQYRKAIEYEQQALEIAKLIGDRQGEANAYNNLGNVYSRLKQYKKAIQFYDYSLDFIRKTQIGNRHCEAACYSNLGIVYFFLKKDKKARDFSKKALKILQEIGDIRSEADTWFNLGETLRKLRRKSEALQAYQNARQLYQIMKLDLNVQHCNHRILFVQWGYFGVMFYFYKNLIFKNSSL